MKKFIINRAKDNNFEYVCDGSYENEIITLEKFNDETESEIIEVLLEDIKRKTNFNYKIISKNDDSIKIEANEVFFTVLLQEMLNFNFIFKKND